MKTIRTLLISVLLGTASCSQDLAPTNSVPQSAHPKLNPQNVPEEFRDLIPMAEKWGISDDVYRSDFEEQSTSAERQELIDVVTPKWEMVDKWVMSFPSDKLTDEAAAFMFMLEAMEEMPKPEE